jgi:hypothetical protein
VAARGSLVRASATAPRQILNSARAWLHGRVLAALVVAGASVPVVVYLWIALHRVDYPYELDWMEGGSVEMVARVMAGHSLYAAPSLNFVGWTYPPLYWLVCTAVAAVTGTGFLPLRLVSLVSSLVAMGTLAKIVTDESGDRSAGAVAAGLFAATYALSGSWFDVGRLDSMFLAVTLVALAYGRRARGVRGGLLLGLLGFLAFFTKQTALIALIPAFGWLALTRRSTGVTALLTLLALVLGSTLVLDALTGGWYRYYVVTELAGQAWAAPEWLGFWKHDLLSHLWPLCVLLVVAVAATRGRAVKKKTTGHPPRPAVAQPGYLVASAAGLLLGAWFSRLHTGGYLNVLLPAYAACALIGALAYARMRQYGLVRSLLATIAIAVQLALLAYPVDAQLPTRTDRLAGTQLMARLRALPGPTLVLNHPWYGTLAGKGSFAQYDGIREILRSQAPMGARVLWDSLPHALDTDHIQSVVLDGYPIPSWLAPQLKHDFRLQSTHITQAKLTPLTDLRVAPSLVYVRRARS